MDTSMNGSSRGVVRKAESSADAEQSKRRKVDAKEIDASALPADWPALEGPIDLAVQDLPHATSNTEWWYVNGHLTSTDGRQFSYFASFFRAVAGWDAEAKEYRHVHALSWALIDVDNKKYYANPLVDPSAPAIIKQQMAEGQYDDLDPRMRKAMLEVVEKNNVPLPDRMIPGDCEVALDRCSLNFGGYTFLKDDQGNYHVKCEFEEKGNTVGFNLKFVPKKKVTRQGRKGVVQVGRQGEQMFYYFIPRSEVTGSIKVEGKTLMANGTGWYDHEFGGKIIAGPESESDEKKETNDSGIKVKKMEDFAWNWLSVQLEDGTDVTATTVISGAQRDEIVENYAVVVGANSERSEYETSVFTPKIDDTKWTSIATLVDYPTQWTLDIADMDMHLEIKAAFPDQEYVTLISRPAFWEGRMEVTGTIGGKPVKGAGFIERHGFQENSSLDKFFKRVNVVVRQEIADVLPLNPTYEDVRMLMANDEMDHYMDGVNLHVFTESIIRPIREIVDRGGKSWRSYALILCIDAVGGHGANFRHWLAMPEIMHVGSLIVDDIQDESESRRGGPTCHKLFGSPIAINAGTAAYFLGLHILQARTDLTPAKRLKLYQLYVLTLRAGHSGQAFDIYGLAHIMDKAVVSGDCTELKKAIVCTHRLKSAVPAGNLARMGGLAGDGTAEQIEALGSYFESVGVAFQIIDDVLNLRGLPGKTKGEDIHAGKVTYPIAIAMAGDRMNAEERKFFWEKLKSKPTDTAVVEDLLNRLNKCNALADSEQQARDMINEAWRKLDSILPDSLAKLHIRAFGYYVLDRHY
jgi:geranylgeranyl pyrophosphate synthase/predicted secreted hydrolase